MEQIICVSCKNSFNAKMKYCPFCGAERVLPPSVAKPSCPVCKDELQETAFGKDPVYICKSCEGLWLDMPIFSKLTSERHVYMDTTIPFTYIRGPLENRVSYIPCPRCAKIMVRRNFRTISGIIIDWCGDHGAWLDKGELEQIRTFIASGGIDKDQDRSIEQNRDNLDNLKTKVRDLELMEKILHKWDLKRIRFRKL